jgi:hypothetical protein
MSRLDPELAYHLQHFAQPLLARAVEPVVNAMTPDPDPYCDHDWQFAERPSTEAKPVVLKALGVPDELLYAAEPTPVTKDKP